MENKHIVYEKREMEALPIEKEGLYNELLVSNGTSNPIYFINQDNTRAIVHPDQNLRNGKVTLFNRVAAGTEQKRYVPGQMGKVEKPLSTKIATIDRSEIEKGFCYVEKFNIVLANMDIGESLKHPKNVKEYTEVLADVNSSLCGTNSLTITVAINDPLGRVSKMYACIGGNVCAVVCTAQTTRDSLTRIIVSTCSNGSVKEQEDTDIEEIHKTGFFACNSFDTLITLGLDPNIALSEYGKKQARREAQVLEGFRESINDDHEVATKELTTKVKDLSAKIDEKDIQLRKAKTDKLALEGDLEVKEGIINRYKASAEWDAVKIKDRMAEGINRSKSEEQYYKTRRAQDSWKTDVVKTVGGTIAVVASACVGAAIKEYLNKRT
jgi:hypothetical protein